jgi:hypothetical protein
MKVQVDFPRAAAVMATQPDSSAETTLTGAGTAQFGSLPGWQLMDSVPRWA